MIRKDLLLFFSDRRSVIVSFAVPILTARGVTTLAVLMMVMLGEAWVPTFIFPAWLQQFTLIVPVRWPTSRLRRRVQYRCCAAIQVGGTVVIGLKAQGSDKGSRPRDQGSGRRLSAHVAPLLNGSVAERAMNRSPVVVIVAVGLVIYGIYAASFIPPLLAGTPAPVLLAGFLVQACAAFLAAFGVWGGARWAPGAVVLLGVVIAVTELAEAFVLGIIAYDHALIVGLLSILVTFAIAAFLRNPRTIAV